jgi:hypothetical protein
LAKRDWRKNATPVHGPLWTNEWFRSPLWDKDHLLGVDEVWQDDEIAWCGRALGYARDWDNKEYGGLFITNRTSAHCAYCARRQKEWDARVGTA